MWLSSRFSDEFTFTIGTYQALLVQTSQNEWVVNSSCTHPMAKYSSLLSSLDVAAKNKIYVDDDLVRTTGFAGPWHLWIFWRRSIDWLTSREIDSILDWMVDDSNQLHGWTSADWWDKGRWGSRDWGSMIVDRFHIFLKWLEHQQLYVDQIFLSLWELVRSKHYK